MCVNVSFFLHDTTHKERKNVNSNLDYTQFWSPRKKHFHIKLLFSQLDRNQIRRRTHISAISYIISNACRLRNRRKTGGKSFLVSFTFAQLVTKERRKTPWCKNKSFFENWESVKERAIESNKSLKIAFKSRSTSRHFQQK